jgi:hypothetical protein
MADRLDARQAHFQNETGNMLVNNALSTGAGGHIIFNRASTVSALFGRVLF